MRIFPSMGILFLFVTATSAGAQDRGPDEMQVIAAAAAHLDALLGDSVIAVDPRIAARAHRSATGTFEGEWPDEILEILTSNLGARSVRQADVVQCTSGRPSTCRITGADIFIKFGRPAMAADTATVYVDFVFPSGSIRTPIAGRQHEIVLNLVRGQWRVVLDRVVAQS